jgi:hypothetical protein
VLACSAGGQCAEGRKPFGNNTLCGECESEEFSEWGGTCIRAFLSPLFSSSSFALLVAPLRAKLRHSRCRFHACILVHSLARYQVARRRTTA